MVVEKIFDVAMSKRNCLYALLRTFWAFYVMSRLNNVYLFVINCLS